MKTKDLQPHSHSLRKGRISESSQIYFITKCIDRSTGVDLTQEDLAISICEAVLYRKRKKIWHLLCFVLMPDHLHLLIALGIEISLSKSMGDFSRFTSLNINSLLKRQRNLWQNGFYDHSIRRSVEKCPMLTEYIHNNPVRKGLCSFPEDWRWSTAHSTFACEIESEWFW